MTEGTEERKEIEVQLGRREKQVQALASVHGVEAMEKREKEGKREPRAVQALALKDRRESLASLGPLGPLVPLALQPIFQLAVTAQLFQGSLDPEDQLDHMVSQAHRDHQELMESQVILVRMEKLVLKDLQASQELQVTLDPKGIRETAERDNRAPGDPQVLLDPQDLESDLLLWTWKALGSPLWILPRGHQVPLVPLVPLVLLVPLQQVQH